MKTREQRREVFICARMRSGSAWVDVSIRNISSRGFLLQAAAPPPRGTYVEIFRAEHIIVGRVVWTTDRQFGIRTQDRIDVNAIIEALPSSTRMATATGRESDPRQQPRATPSQRLERSRRLSAAFEFISLVACGAAAAAIMAIAVQDILLRPLQQISNVLNI